jgi:L-ascorbate metabolism protein UlaG (beta-lactamase superfamily)
VRLARRLLLVVLAAGAVVYAAREAMSRPVPPTVTPTPRAWSAGDLNVAWVGHASVLVGFGATTILTDPAFFERIGVQLGPVTVGPRRLVEPALRPTDLPSLDAVLVSHAHMDSLDRPSLRAVAGGARLLVVPPRTRDLVDDLGFARVIELGWGERVRAGDVDIEAVELRHWGRRWPWDGWRGYNGYLLSRGDVRVLFASDTAYTDAVGRLGAARPLAAAILGNGAYDPWIRNHADPEQVWRMFRESGAGVLIPIHWDTFRLGKEPLGDALARLLAAAGPEADRVVVRRIGETWTVPLATAAGASVAHRGGLASGYGHFRGRSE